jgi:hypothetical protein
MATPKIVTEDIQAGWDESQFDRVGAPIKFAQEQITPGDEPAPVVKKSHTLTDLSAEFEFFTTGVILAATPFDRDPVAEFLQTRPPATPELAPKAIDSIRPFFTGLGKHRCNNQIIDFDHRLYMIHRDAWEDLRDTISGIAMLFRDKAFFGRVNFYETKMVDIFLLKKQQFLPSLPEVPLTVFGVSTTETFAYLERRGELLALIKEPPRPESQVELKTWL